MSVSKKGLVSLALGASVSGIPRKSSTGGLEGKGETVELIEGYLDLKCVLGAYRKTVMSRKQLKGKQGSRPLREKD